MPRRSLLAAVGLTVALAAPAQEPVVGVPNAESLFTSRDRWLTARYIQHNPNAPSGRTAVVHFFTQVVKAQPKPIPAKLSTPIVAVLAEGDYAVVVIPRTRKDPKDASKSYSMSWFDMWRFVDGKADEHWDAATKDLPF